MEDLKIVYLPPGCLKPYERNARRHAEEDLDVIKASIRENGFCDPIGIWGPQNLIVEGHGRQIAALELGLEKVPCIRLDELTDEQRRLYSIAHNRTAETSSWDFAKLESELEKLGEYDMTLFGFQPTFTDLPAIEPDRPSKADDINSQSDSRSDYQPEQDKYIECPRCKHRFIE